MLIDIALIFFFIVAVFFSAMYSGGEIGIYQLSSLRLRVGINSGSNSFKALGRALSDRISLLLSILVGNNVVNYIATSFLTYFILRRSENNQGTELLATIITTPILFVFGELLPKSLFYYRPDTLTPRVGNLLYFTQRFLQVCGIAPAIKILVRIFTLTKPWEAQAEEVFIMSPRRPIKSLIREIHEEGVLSPVQADIMQRIDRTGKLILKTVMTSLGQAESIDVSSGREDLILILQKSPDKRVTVFENSKLNIIGFIDIYEALNSIDDFQNIRRFVMPMMEISVWTSVSDAIDLMRSKKARIALVTRPAKRRGIVPCGIVTHRELVDQLLGELAGL